MLGKILLLALAVWLLLTLLKQYRRNLNRNPKNQQAPQDMVRCRSCGIHLPKAECVQKNGEYYCCAEHSEHAEP